MLRGGAVAAMKGRGAPATIGGKSMTTRIGFLTERMLLGYGVDLVVHRYAAALAALPDFDVVVYCLRHDDSVARPYRVTNLLEASGFGRSVFLSRDVPAHAAYLNAQPVDLWIANTPDVYDLVPFLDSPSIVIEYGTPDPGFFADAKMADDVKRSIHHRFARVFPRLREQDGVVGISESIRNWLPAGLGARARVNHLGVDHYPRVAPEEARAFREQLGVADAVMVLWVGRMQLDDDPQPYKGFRAFVDMAERLRREEPRLRFVAVGRGGDQEAAFLEARGILPLLNLPDDCMGLAFAAADLFVSTSLWEGFNLPLLEAQFQGTPVVAYARGPHVEVVKDGETGLLVGSEDAVGDAILALARDPARRARLAAQAPAFAEGFTWDRSVRRLEDAIDTSLTIARGSTVGGKAAVRLGPLRRRLFPVEDMYVRAGAIELAKRVSGALARRLLGRFSA